MVCRWCAVVAALADRRDRINDSRQLNASSYHRCRETNREYQVPVDPHAALHGRRPRIGPRHSEYSSDDDQGRWAHRLMRHNGDVAHLQAVGWRDQQGRIETYMEVGNALGWAMAELLKK
jgi:hypothetical protein